MAQIFHTAEFFSIQPHPPREARSALWNAKLYKDTYKFSATPAIEKKYAPWYTKHDNYRALPERTRSATHPMEIAGGETMAKNAIVGQSGGPTSVINASLAGVYEYIPDAFHLHYHCELPAPYPAFHNTVH